jgi:hypothetical protein
MARCTNRFHLFELKDFCEDPSPQVRKHVAKALRKLEAWTLLNEMAAANPDDAAVQWFAKSPTTQRSYPERLARFLDSVEGSSVPDTAGPSRMPYWSLHSPWQGRPAKSVEFIRTVLLHIRQLLRGNGHAH